MDRIYEFRPLPNDPWLKGGFGDLLRYADGKWIQDDGEYDVAFVKWNMVLYVSLHYQKNILWKWTTKHWSANEPLHRSGNPWHYHLRDGQKEWGGNWGRDRHVNTVVGSQSMKYSCSLANCANGHGPEFDLNDPYIKAGLVRDRDTKAIVVPPEHPECMYCQLKWEANRVA